VNGNSRKFESNQDTVVVLPPTMLSARNKWFIASYLVDDYTSIFSMFPELVVLQ
jgi:hypothetical protein